MPLLKQQNRVEDQNPDGYGTDCVEYCYVHRFTQILDSRYWIPDIYLVSSIQDLFAPIYYLFTGTTPNSRILIRRVPVQHPLETFF